MKLTNLITALSMTVLLASCGGGGADTTPQASAFTAEEQNAAAVTLDNPPLVGPPQAADVARLRAARLEKWKDGDATSAPVIPADKMGVDPKAGRAHILKAGDPVQRPMGSTVEVAPTPTTIPIDAPTKGMWSGVYNWPLIPIHMAMLPDGRLMSYGTNEGGRQTGKTVYAVFDPSLGLTNGHTVFPKETLADIFCSAMIFLPITNQMITVGGDNLQPDGFTNNTGNNSSTIFTPGTNSMIAGRNMALPRWYATVTTLLDGTTYIQGGLGGEAYPELRLANGTFKSLTTAPTQNLDYWYPRNWLHNSGRIFGYDSYGNYYFITPTGTGVTQIINQWDVNAFGEAGSAVMFSPGKILQLAAFTNRASVIDITTNNPTITATAPMNARRQNVNATVLPNGKVLATGGSTVYNDVASAQNTAIIWDPATGQWTQGSDGYLARLYHSVGMLQPDGTVLVGGGGAWGPLSNTNAEFYYPPYLFNPDGTLATRPLVTAAPTTMEVAGTFKLTVSDAQAPITRVTMIKSGSITHSVNFDQNFNNLTFTRVGNELTVKLPTSAYDATPGYYMVFGLTAAGTPSQARMIRLNVPTLANPAPTALTAVYAVSTGVTLNWTQSTGVGTTHNIISRGTSAAGPFTQLAKIPANTRFVDPNQTVGTYYYTVSAVNTNEAISVNSNVVTVTIGNAPPPPVTVPGAPSGLAGAYTNGTGVALNWTNSGTVTNVSIERRSGAGVYAVIGTVGNVQTYTDPIAVQATYTYRVRASNSVGNSTYSNLASVQVTAPPPSTLVAPTGLSGYTCGNGCWTTDTGVRFNWTPNQYGTGQIVQRAEGTATTFTTVATLGATVSLFVDKNVVSGTKYFYRVQATTATSSSPYATLAYAITSDITLGGTPPPPTAGSFGIVSQEQTQYLVMNWWRADPATEGDYRDPNKVGGSCTGPASAGGNCYLGARKTFRPMGFNIGTAANGAPVTVQGMILMDVPQFVDGAKTYDHYKLPIEMVKTGCTFKVQHVRTHGTLEFSLNPPGLEILDHKFTLSQALCDSYPTGAMTQAWLNTLNTALTTYLGPKVPYAPEAYPYNDPRTHTDPTL